MENNIGRSLIPLLHLNGIGSVIIHLSYFENCGLNINIFHKELLRPSFRFQVVIHVCAIAADVQV